MKRTLGLALLFCAAAAAAQSVDTGTFVYANARAFHTLDPVAADDVVSYIVSANLYESLITFASTRNVDQFKPLLASQVPSRENGLLSADGLVYDFPIRKDAHFHDGSALTPEDVRYSLLRFMFTPTEEGRSSMLLRPLLGLYDASGAAGKPGAAWEQAAAAVQVRGADVVLTLAKPDASFLKVLASLPIITSKAWTAAHGGWDGTEKGWEAAGGRLSHPPYLEQHEDGTGPFRLDSVSRPDTVLARFDGYWRAPAALRRVIVRTVPDGAMRLLMLESGDADAAYLESSYRPFLRAAPDIQTVSDLPDADMGNIFFFTFKTADDDNPLLGSGKLDGAGLPADFFSDPDARRALAYAFDYERFFKQAIGGDEAKDQGLFPSALMDIPRKAPFVHDAAQAAALLKKVDGGAAWSDGLVLPIAYLRSDATRQAAARIMKQDLEALNPKFKVRLHPMDAGEFYAKLRAGALPLYVSSYYSDYPDAQALAFGLLHSRGAFPRLQGYADAKADALIEQAAATADPAARRALYLKLADLAGQDVPQIYTFSPLPMRVCRADVVGCDTTDDTNNLAFNNFPYFYAYSKK